MSREELRPIDLARLAGISTQQVRNYVADGILPPAARTAAGYRRLDDRHRRALLAFRALARGSGLDTARAIMRAVHAGDLPQSLALIDAGHAALHDQRRALQETAAALAAIAEQEREPAPAIWRRSGMRIGEAAAQLGVRPSALRVWEDAGLLRPQRESGTSYRRYGATDLREARMILLLRQGRYGLSQIRPVLDGLRQTGGSAALRATIAQRETELTERSRAMLEGAGYLQRYLSGAREEIEEIDE